MKYFLNRMYFVILVLLLNACTNTQYEKQQSVYIVFKTPSFKYADLGFMYQKSNTLKIEIYGSGQPIMTLNVSEKKVCMSFLKCMNKKEFNTRILSHYYPDKMIENIFRGKSIFNGKNFIQKRNSFTQNIQEGNKYDIKYKVFKKEIQFRDTINNILIKVKRMGA